MVFPLWKRLFGDAYEQRQKPIDRKDGRIFQAKRVHHFAVKVFEPNVNAHQLYRKLGYNDRIIDMIKKL
jgi:hypothetical protein